MATINLVRPPESLQNVVQKIYGGANLYLGLITEASAVASNLYKTNRAGIIAAEYNASGWTRPLIAISAIGAYDPDTGQWNLPTNLEFSITVTELIHVKQIFVMLGGAATPRDTTGIMDTFGEFASPISIPPGVPTPLTIPFSVK